ncbi:MAG: hypothetical protein EAZ85_01690 [Bacteroidetes bacterium]|nr:MAG: hypothetical protein EAZ85_01690 [Bacteroidota bacterium]TAG89945.1 MAG: hypothetical protein EAZ20_05435 [Bacteroidota bacterium]
MKKLFFLSFCFIYFALNITLKAQDNAVPTSWAKAKKDKKGKITIYYYDVKPFFYTEAEQRKGPEAELIENFVKYVKRQFWVDLEVEYKAYEEFPKYYEKVKNGISGEFGIGTTSITEKRLTEVKMSNAYLPDIDVMVNSPNLGIAKDTTEWLKMFKNAKAVTIPNSTFEKKLLEFKKIKPDLDFTYVQNRGKVREKILENDNLFALYPLPDYLYWHKEGSNLKRQTLFSLQREGYGVIMPKKSDWDGVLNAFLEDVNFKKEWQTILETHFSKEIHQFIKSYSGEKNKEMALLYHEKEQQGAQIEKNQTAMKLQEARQSMLILILTIIVLIIILVIGLIFVQIRNNKVLKSKNKEIEAQKEELEVSYNVLNKQNRQITDSIKAAKSIQSAMLPFKPRIKYTLGEENFVIYKPKDIVSGDFYWLGTTPAVKNNEIIIENEKIFVALADCTGHGVPGAFMSMLGYSFLNDIINSQDIHQPAKILEALHKTLRKALSQDEEQNQEGMDLALICIEKINKINYKVCFAGAKRNLLYYTDNELKEIQGDRKSIGGAFATVENREFIEHQIELKQSDMLYIYSDGFTDVANPQRKNLGKKKLKETLIENIHLPCAQQKEILKELLTNYQAGTEQRDDITFWGIRLTM